MSDNHTLKNRQAAVLACLSIIPVVVISLIIFGFSSESGTTSGGASEKIAKTLIDIFVVNYDDFPEEKQIFILERVHHYVRKFAHFSEFGALGFFTFIHCNCIGRCLINNGKYLFIRKKVCVERANKLSVLKYGWLYSAVYGIVYASADEIHQAFVPNRGPGVLDVMIDTAGVICGILLIMFFRLLFIKNKKQ